MSQKIKEVFFAIENGKLIKVNTRNSVNLGYKMNQVTYLVNFMQYEIYNKKCKLTYKLDIIDSVHEGELYAVKLINVKTGEEEVMIRQEEVMVA